MAYKLREYLTTSGENVFRAWLSSLSVQARARIQARLFRMEQGNLGDYKSVGHGVCELRLAFGPGYRVYFGFASKEVLLLLLGGDKHSQKKDITRARRLWLDYMERKKNGKA